jgi:Rrf2 family protein
MVRYCTNPIDFRRESLRVSAKADYAVRALLELAAAGGASLSADVIAARQGIPQPFLQKILHELQTASVVVSQRGREGGHRLARAPGEISLADVLRAVEGPLADVRGIAPEDTSYEGPAERLQEVWIALRANVRAVLEAVTLADLVEDRLPAAVVALASRPESWITRAGARRAGARRTAAA